jgi:hypothetical protein
MIGAIDPLELGPVVKVRSRPARGRRGLGSVATSAVVRAPWIALSGIAWLCVAACTPGSESSGGTTSASSERARLEKIKAEALAAHPGNAEEGTRAANEALEREVTAMPRGKLTPKQTAAAVFLGYYAKNASGLPTACAERGVRLDAFSARFVQLHAGLLQTADRVVDTTRLLARAKETSVTDAKKYLERVAAAQSTDAPGACRWIEANAKELAEGGTFAKIMPNVYATLTQPE